MRFTTIGSAPNRDAFRQNSLLQGLLLWYAALWIFLAISPVDRSDWALENILAMAFVLVLILTYRRFLFSDLSYVLITIFLTVHAVGAHYTYSQVPLGFWLKDALGLSRNHYDRIVHFAFGLLMHYPIREMTIRRAAVREPWSYVVAIAIVQACSDLFEIIEAVVAQIVAPDLGNAYLGTQGDPWDAQKDMAAAFSGAVVAAGLTLAIPRSYSPKPRPAA